ncbi:MAG TPA: phage portal protein [Actinoplanes sp.]
MTLFRAARATVQEYRNSIENPAVPLTSTTLAEFLGPGQTSAGVGVNEQSALAVSAVYRSVNLIAGTSAGLPLHAFKKDGDTRTRVGPESQAGQLLDDPHPDMTPFEFWETVYGHKLLWGNAYLRKVRNRLDQIVELWPIHPGRIRAGRASDGSKVYEGDRGAHAWTDREILHIPGFGYDGVCGVSPIRLAREGLGLALAAEDFGARFFRSGSLMSGILQTEQRLDKTQADALKAQWKAKVSGLGNAHDVAVLDSGAKFQQMSVPPGDAQFLESRQFQVTEVARWYGIPPHMLMQTEKSTSWGTGIEQQGIGFVTYTLQPWLIRVEQRLTKMLRPGSVYARYSVQGLLRGDSAAEAAYNTAMWNIGALSTNEIRAFKELPPVDGGDVRYRPLNMGVLGQADPAPAPAGPPPGDTDSSDEEDGSDAADE